MLFVWNEVAFALLHALARPWQAHPSHASGGTSTALALGPHRNSSTKSSQELQHQVLHIQGVLGGYLGEEGAYVHMVLLLKLVL
jgi:hypothetical protein